MQYFWNRRISITDLSLTDSLLTQQVRPLTYWFRYTCSMIRATSDCRDLVVASNLTFVAPISSSSESVTTWCGLGG